MPTIVSCQCCGLIQTLPPVPRGMVASCARCSATLPCRLADEAARRSVEVVALALGALILYPVAVTLPIMQIEQFGHRTQTSILGGIAAMFSSGQLIVGVIVLLCSVIFPLGKLLALLTLSLDRLPNALRLTGIGMAHRHKAFTYRLVEWTGRWGMLDVLLVAVLVAALKLGNMMDVTPGPAAAAFGVCVTLSLIATARFDPHSFWEAEP